MFWAAGCGGPGSSVQPTAESTLPPPIVPSSARVDGSTLLKHPDVLVIVGVDADHMIITEELAEVLPPEDGVPASVHLRFETEGDQPVILGIEGAIGFVSAHAPDGSVVLDRMVEMQAGEEVVEMPGGDYLLRLYYRPCDGNCGLLDPAQEFCSIEESFVAGARYDVTVTMQQAGPAHCTFQPRID
jgi:hypothetical protein